MIDSITEKQDGLLCAPCSSCGQMMVRFITLMRDDCVPRSAETEWFCKCGYKTNGPTLTERGLLAYRAALFDAMNATNWNQMFRAAPFLGEIERRLDWLERQVRAAAVVLGNEKE